MTRRTQTYLQAIIDRTVAVVIQAIADLWRRCDLAFTRAPTSRRQASSLPRTADPFSGGRWRACVTGLLCPWCRASACIALIDLTIAIVILAIADLRRWNDLISAEIPSPRRKAYLRPFFAKPASSNRAVSLKASPFTSGVAKGRTSGIIGIDLPVTVIVLPVGTRGSVIFRLRSKKAVTPHRRGQARSPADLAALGAKPRPIQRFVARARHPRYRTGLSLLAFALPSEAAACVRLVVALARKAASLPRRIGERRTVLIDADHRTSASFQEQDEPPEKEEKPKPSSHLSSPFLQPSSGVTGFRRPSVRHTKGPTLQSLRSLASQRHIRACRSWFFHQGSECNPRLDNRNRPLVGYLHRLGRRSRCPCCRSLRPAE